MKLAIKFELFDINELEYCTAKSIYVDLTSTFPPPKCIYKIENLPWSTVWKNLENPVIDSSIKDLMFSLIHNILPNRQRMFRLRKTQNEICRYPSCQIWRESSGPLNFNVENL